MSNYSRRIVYLSEQQKTELFTNHTITVNGTTITYNENDIYVTPQEQPYIKPINGIPASDLATGVVNVNDVQINNNSIISNGIANIPMGGGSTLGVLKTDTGFGSGVSSGGAIAIVSANESMLKSGTNVYRPVMPSCQHQAVFFGLSKVAGVDLANETITLGTYPDNSKAAIQNMLGITSLLSTEEFSTATAAHALNSTFMMDGKLYKATAAIVIGDAVVEGQNCEVVKADEVFVKNTDYADGSTYGLVKISNGGGLRIIANGLATYAATSSEVKAGANQYKAIVPQSQHEAIFYGLSKLAGVDLKDETVTVGTYPETSKTAIRSLIGAGTPLDVQVNNTSIVSNGIANIPYATSSEFGVTAAGNGLRISGSTNKMIIDYAGSAKIKAGTEAYNPIVPYIQHEAAFYGLAKAAGVDMASSDNAVGTYTESAKTAIRSMIGATSSNIVAVQDTQPTEADAKVWMMETAPESIEVPTYAEFQSLDAAVVKKTDYASDSTAGIVKLNSTYGIRTITSTTSTIGTAVIQKASETDIKEGTHEYRPIVPQRQHLSIYYGLSKLAGVDLANETVTVGTYPATASAAIRSMLGAVGDVQVNGNSIVSNGIATIPLAQNSSTAAPGLVKINWGGLQINSSGFLQINPATSSEIKAATASYVTICPARQHESVFYGLAKAAGDTTMASSSNAVGTYTTEARAAIRNMLGVETSIELIEAVSGTTPTIVGQPNITYQCGEVSTINITPPANGTIDVYFTSGSTAAVLTVPSTIKWPAWFDVEALESNTIYELMITNGTYGSVMTWQS